MSGSGPGVGNAPQSRYTKPLAEQLEHRQNNTTDAQFKKTHQVVGKPETTDHDLHEDFIKNPPKNLVGDPAGDAPTAGNISNAPNTVEAKSVDEIKSRIGDT